MLNSISKTSVWHLWVLTPLSLSFTFSHIRAHTHTHTHTCLSSALNLLLFVNLPRICNPGSVHNCIKLSFSVLFLACFLFTFFSPSLSVLLVYYHEFIYVWLEHRLSEFIPWMLLLSAKKGGGGESFISIFEGTAVLKLFMKDGALCFMYFTVCNFLENSSPLLDFQHNRACLSVCPNCAGIWSVCVLDLDRFHFFVIATGFEAVASECGFDLIVKTWLFMTKCYIPWDSAIVTF